MELDRLAAVKLTEPDPQHHQHVEQADKAEEDDDTAPEFFGSVHFRDTLSSVMRFLCHATEQTKARPSSAVDTVIRSFIDIHRLVGVTRSAFFRQQM